MHIHIQSILHLAGQSKMIDSITRSKEAWFGGGQPKLYEKSRQLFLFRMLRLFTILRTPRIPELSRGLGPLLHIVVITVLQTSLLPPKAIASEKTSKPIKIGFLMVGSVNDVGWNYNHNQGRMLLQNTLSPGVETTYMEKVPESAEAERAMERMIAQGDKIIFATSYGYLEPAMRVAARHPDVIILETANRFNTSNAKNVASYVMDYSAPMFVSGVVAGRLSKSGNLGFVAAHPVPPILVAINSFILGARSVNPHARCRVVWTNSWSDPATEAEAVRGLVERGVDVVASNLDSSLAAAQAAEEARVFAVGTHADLSKRVPKAWLTGLRFDWGKLDIKVVNSINNGTWKPGNSLLDSTTKYAALLPFGSSVPKPVQAQALQTLKLFRAGKLNVFTGPMNDRDNIERIPAGKKLNLKDLLEMNWLVSGVEGPLPKK